MMLTLGERTVQVHNSSLGTYYVGTTTAANNGQCRKQRQGFAWFQRLWLPLVDG
jgi:hypothetical protein